MCTSTLELVRVKEIFKKENEGYSFRFKFNYQGLESTEIQTIDYFLIVQKMIISSRKILFTFKNVEEFESLLKNYEKNQMIIISTLTKMLNEMITRNDVISIPAVNALFNLPKTITLPKPLFSISEMKKIIKFDSGYSYRDGDYFSEKSMITYIYDRGDLASFGKVWNYVEEIEMSYWHVSTFDHELGYSKITVDEGFSQALLCVKIIPPNEKSSTELIVAGCHNGKILILDPQHYQTFKQFKEKSIFSDPIIKLSYYKDQLICATKTHIKIVQIGSYEVIGGGNLAQRLNTAKIANIHCLSKGILLVGTNESFLLALDIKTPSKPQFLAQIKSTIEGTINFITISNDHIFFGTRNIINILRVDSLLKEPMCFSIPKEDAKIQNATIFCPGKLLFFTSEGIVGMLNLKGGDIVEACQLTLQGYGEKFTLPSCSQTIFSFEELSTPKKLMIIAFSDNIQVISLA